MDLENGLVTPQNLLSIAQYTMELFRPGHKLATVSLQEIVSALKHGLRKRSTEVKCVSVPSSAHHALIPSSVFNNECVFDLISCGIVGSQAAIALGVPVGGSCWAFLSNCGCSLGTQTDHNLSCHNRNHPNKTYAMQVVANSQLPSSEMILSEEMYHNISKYFLGLPILSSDLLVTMKRCEMFIKRNEVNELSFFPHFAEKAVVSLIDVPNFEDGNDITTLCLNNYFKSPRHVHRGDIFKINIKEYAPEAVYLYRNYHYITHLYIIVNKLEGNPYKNVKNADKSVGYIISQGVTTLLQNKSVQSFIPSSTISDQSRIISSRMYKDALLSQCPPALSQLYDDLVSCVQPFLRKSLGGLRPAFLLIGPEGSGKWSLLSAVAAHFGMHVWCVDCSEVKGTTPGQTEGKLRAVFAKAKRYAPCLFILSNIEIICKDQDEQEDFRVMEDFWEQVIILSKCSLPVITIGTSSSSINLNSSLSRMFLQEFHIPSLGKSESESQLKWLLSQYQISASQPCIEHVSSRCSGFLLADIKELVSEAVRRTLDDQNNVEKQEGIVNIELSMEHFENALDQMQSRYAGAIGAPKIPSVKWSDVGGLGHIKEEILRTITMPLKHPELISAGLRRSGVLLYGPPGTGKTLIAKAVATECSLNFLSVKGPELLNMYVGQSEANVREVFDRARKAEPCIIFFDELDSLAPSRGRSGDSGGVMDRVVSQLLSEMDGLQKSNLLFVIGATNRPDLVDPALLRPGRFDKLMYVGACEDRESQTTVLTTLTQKFILSTDVNLISLAQELPARVTGADIYAVCSEAWMGAVRRLIKSMKPKTDADLPASVEVTHSDFQQAIANLVPSVSAEDMIYFKRLQRELSSK